MRLDHLLSRERTEEESKVHSRSIQTDASEFVDSESCKMAKSREIHEAKCGVVE